MTITEDYVSFEVAKLLKEKGFNEPCNAYWFHMIDAEPIFNDNMPRQVYNNKSDTIEIIGCPTLQMAMKWLREVYNIYYEVQLLLGDKAAKYGNLQLGVYQLSSSGAYIWECCLYADTYEELYEKYIKYCLENLI